MKISTIGLDLAKEVFQIHAVDEHGKVVQKKKLKRKEMSTYYANLEPCLIGMEACGSSHYWARKLQSMGHTVKQMAFAIRQAVCENQQERCGGCRSHL